MPKSHGYRLLGPWHKTQSVDYSPPPVGKGVETSVVADEMGVGSVEKTEKLAIYYRQKADLLGIHFLDAAGCEFNQVDFMHLTQKGHRQLADLILEKLTHIL